MVSFKSLFLLALSASSALAAPVSESPASVVTRQSRGGTCGSNDYTVTEIRNARGEGCNLYQNGETVGNNDYPHTFNNREGFDFLVSGPYQEFPILASGRVFDGSTSPGPDRVIFNTGCQYAGLITHTGASGNNFVSCDY